LSTEGETRLRGGRQTQGVVRIGDTIRRPLHRNSQFVHAVLRHLEAVGFEGAPRLLGIDDQGREVLAYIEGRVYVSPEEQAGCAEILSDAKLISAARLIRGFHGATAGTMLARGAKVVCHSDLGQHTSSSEATRQSRSSTGTRTWRQARVWSTSDTPSGASRTSASRAATWSSKPGACDCSASVRLEDGREVIDEIEARVARPLVARGAGIRRGRAPSAR